MDILRKELNEIYESQHLDSETLDPQKVVNVCRKAQTLAAVGGGCTVITDASCDRCFIFTGALGPLMGFSEKPEDTLTMDSSDEDTIYLRMHPEDLADKRMLEYELFKLADRMAPAGKTSVRATCTIRMKDRDGNYRLIDNITQVIGLSPAGKIWLILCCYNISTGIVQSDGISAHIVNTATGNVTEVRLGEKRRQILTTREKEVLSLIRKGLPSKQIADRLDISIHTVNRHRQNIIEKLSVGNSIEAVTAALAMKLL